MELRAFDLSSATDRFPLTLQWKVVETLFNRVTAFAWVISGLGVNVFKAPGSQQEDIYINIYFRTGQPLGFLSSWPLFTMCHHLMVWLASEEVYPGKRFRQYALLGDDIVI